MTALPVPFFLESPKGRRLAVYHTPNGDVEAWGQILCVPAFNEEMNRCRSMVTKQARAFAEQGVGTLVIDLYGTGESDGEHGDASWETWLDDIAAGIGWLDKQAGGCIALLGIRLGVPLAAQALRSTTKSGLALIAWQPVIDGKAYFTQFLRMRIAANMDRTDIPKETTSALRGEIAAGRSVEIAGYEIRPELAAAIEALHLSKTTPPAMTPTAWFERTAATTRDLPPASLSVVEAWRSEGLQVHVQANDGPAFWALYDRAIAPSLIEQTTKWVRSLRGRA